MQRQNSKVIKLLMVLALSLFVMSANAELFKWKDADGNIIFSDQPPPGLDKADSELKKETLPHINTVPAPDLTKKQTIRSTKSSSINSSYKDFAIALPVHDSEVRENSGKVLISIQIEPAIFVERGHQLVVYMDGEEVYKGEKLSVQLDNVDRGTHKIKASIVNNQGFVLRETRVTTFTLHRFSI